MHWNIRKLSESIEILDNLRKPINSSERQKRIAGLSEKDLFPYFGATGQVGWIDGYLTDGDYVIVGEDGAPFLDNFKQKAYLIKGKTWVNNHAHVLKEKHGVTINGYILHYLNSINYTDFVNGTTRLKLTQGSLKEIPISIPSLPEQHQIVSKIEELFSELDKGKQQLETVRQQLKTYRQAVLKWAFEGRFTNSEVIEGQLPEGWKIAKLGTVCNKIQDGSHFSPQNQYFDAGVNRYKYITAKNIRNNYMDLSNVKFVDKEFHENIFKRCNPEFGDVLLTKDGVNTGEVTLNTLKEEFSLLSSVCIFKTDKQVLRSDFLKYFIQSNFGTKIIDGSMTGTAIKRIILRKIKEAKIFIPSLNEQEIIVQEIESRLSVCDKIEEIIEISLQQSESLRQSILKQAFEGKLVNAEI